MKKFLGILVLLWSSIVASATEFVTPKQKITGAEAPIALGELVNLSVSEIEDEPDYLVASSYKWRVFEGNTEKKVVEIDSGGAVFFGAGIQPRRMTAICAATHLYLVKETITVGDKKIEVVKEAGTRTSFLVTEIIIGTPPPVPPGPTPPGPGPTPPEPAPAFPVGKYGLSKTTWELAQKVPVEGRAKVASALADSYKGVSAAIAAGAHKDPEQILKAIAASNQAALTSAGGSRETWLPFFVSLQETTYDFYTKGQINSPEDFRTSFLEISTGLAAVK